MGGHASRVHLMERSTSSRLYWGAGSCAMRPLRRLSASATDVCTTLTLGLGVFCFLACRLRGHGAMSNMLMSCLL